MPRPLRSLPAAAAFLLLASFTLSAAGSAGAGTVLHWTAPGDNGWVGTALAYDIRRSTQPITAANFAGADTVAGVPLPAQGGAAQTCSAQLPVHGVTYYFAIKSVDAAGNWSPLSNVVSFADPLLAVGDELESALRFDPPSPNPARGGTRLRFEVPRRTQAVVEVFDTSGRRVRSLWRGPFAPGTTDVAWNLRDDAGQLVAPGLYFARAVLGASVRTRRIVIAS